MGKFASLFEAIHALVNFEVYPSFVIIVREVIFGDEFLRDDGDLDADVFRSVERCAKIEVGDIIACKACIFCGEDAVELQFDEFERPSFVAHVSRIADPVAPNSDGGAVGVSLCGRTSQTTRVYVISLRQLVGMSVYWIGLKVSVPLTRFCVGSRCIWTISCN